MTALKNGAPQTLSPRHYALMRELVSGTSPGVAAEIMGYTLSRASIIVHSVLFQEGLKKMREGVEDKFKEVEGERHITVQQGRRLIEEEALPSIQKIVELRNSADSEVVQLKSATEIADRAGLNKVDKVLVQAKIDVSKSLIFALDLKNASSTTEPS